MTTRRRPFLPLPLWSVYMIMVTHALVFVALWVQDADGTTLAVVLMPVALGSLLVALTKAQRQVAERRSRI